MTKLGSPAPRRAEREISMNRRPGTESWRAYLAEESAGRDAEAEASLAALFVALPVLGPRPGFAGRVMVRLERRSLFALRSVRVGLAAALAAAALAAGLLAPTLLPLAGLIGPGSLVSAAIGALSAVTVRLASGIALWSDAGHLGAALARAVVQPQILGLILIQFAVAVLALRGLTALASKQRSSNHAVL